MEKKKNNTENKEEIKKAEKEAKKAKPETENKADAPKAVNKAGKSQKKKTVIILAVLLVLLGGLLAAFLSGAFDSLFAHEEPEQPVEVEQIDEYEQLKKDWQENKAINDDYVGELVFDSGLLRVSFVQATSVYKPDGTMYTFYNEDGSLVRDPTGYNGNDVYIWTYWKTGNYDYNDNGGSTFMDFRNALTDQNLIIYGHHFSVWNDETRQKAFTPLEKLLEEENYEENKYVTLVLGHEIRKYEIAVVYNFDATSDYYYDNMQYWRTQYNYDDYMDVVDDNYYSNYIKAIHDAQLYDTGVTLTTADKTLTLQTCISGHTGELFEILVLKELETIPY